MKSSLLLPGDSILSRRRFLRGAGLLTGAAFFHLKSDRLFAEELAVTPRLTEGPFYPDKLPLDTDNDLIIVNDSITPALGAVTHVSGRILTKTGAPVRNAVVEIWQVDNHGIYLHSRDNGNGRQRDTNFQGYGRFLTDSSGAYYFRTIKPVPYPGRTPHIHFGISKNGQRIYTTQLFIKGFPQNDHDSVLASAGDTRARESVLVDFKPLAGSRIGELTAHFDIVLGVTPEDAPDGKIKGAIGKSESMGGHGPGGPGGAGFDDMGFGPPPGPPPE